MNINIPSYTYTPDIEAQGGPRMSIPTRLWGSTTWDTLHYISLGYPENNPPLAVQRAAFQFMANLPFLLPCMLCRVHLADTYRRDMPLSPAVFASRAAFATYIVQLRDFIHKTHVCPSCPHKTHTVHEDVVQRLLFPQNDWILWTIPVVLLLVLFQWTRRSPARFT